MMYYSVLDGYLSQKPYDQRRFPLLSKTLSELIKERVKATGLERYKIVALVTICQNGNQVGPSLLPIRNHHQYHQQQGAPCPNLSKSAISNSQSI